jgi:hypothetical protein
MLQLFGRLVLLFQRPLVGDGGLQPRPARQTEDLRMQPDLVLNDFSTSATVILAVMTISPAS